MVTEMELLKVENDLGRLERRWRNKRHKYLQRKADGAWQVPDPQPLAVAAGLALFSALGMGAMALADGRLDSHHFFLLPTLLVAAVVTSHRAWSHESRARAYVVAELDYERQRTSFLRERRELTHLV